MTEPLLDARGVTVHYGGVVALDEVDFTRRRARRSPGSSARTAPARRRCSACCPASCDPRRAGVPRRADLTRATPQKRARLGIGAHVPATRAVRRADRARAPRGRGARARAARPFAVARPDRARQPPGPGRGRGGRRDPRAARARGRRRAAGDAPPPRHRAHRRDRPGARDRSSRRAARRADLGPRRPRDRAARDRAAASRATTAGSRSCSSSTTSSSCSTSPST